MRLLVGKGSGDEVSQEKLNKLLGQTALKMEHIFPPLPTSYL